MTGQAARGRFITLEGGEGAGKSTQLRLLADHLSECGIPVLVTREPGGSPGAEKIRALLLDGQGFDPVAEAMLMFAARREHVVATIRPALEAGMWVISDRFADSTRAYQCHGQGVPGEVYRKLADLALEGLAPPSRAAELETMNWEVMMGLGSRLGVDSIHTVKSRCASTHRGSMRMTRRAMLAPRATGLR
jgi:hypothetical protein